MQYAINSKKERVHASKADKGKEYYCPVCDQKVILRHGDYNIPHYSHVSKCVDEWHYEGEMSEWHLQWQMQFPPGNREFVVENLGEKHRTDVMACGYAIEFQHSRISAAEFKERNDFYRKLGKKIIWVIDLTEEYSENKIVFYDESCGDKGSGGKFRWKNPRRFLHSYVPQRDSDIIVFFQLSDGDHADQNSSYIERGVWAVEDGNGSSFRRFCTAYTPGNAKELLRFVKERWL